MNKLYSLKDTSESLVLSNIPHLLFCVVCVNVSLISFFGKEYITSTFRAHAEKLGCLAESRFAMFYSRMWRKKLIDKETSVARTDDDIIGNRWAKHLGVITVFGGTPSTAGPRSGSCGVAP